jgi:hypothetical protein
MLVPILAHWTPVKFVLKNKILITDVETFEHLCQKGMENLRACETMNSLVRCVRDTELAASDHYVKE